MEESLKNKIEQYLAQDTFKEAIEKYKTGQVFDGLTVACFNDPKSLEPFVMGIMYSTISNIINTHHGGAVTQDVIKEAVIMLREFIEK